MSSSSSADSTPASPTWYAVTTSWPCPRKTTATPGNLAHGLLDTWWLIDPAAPAWWAGHQPGLPRSGLLGIAVTLTEVAALCWLAHRPAPATLPDQQPR